VLACALLAIALHRVGENQTTVWFGALWMAQGHSASEAGALSAWAVAAEFLAMGASARWLARVDLGRVMLCCCAMSALRWAVVPSCQHFACAAALQSVHALSFGVFYPASLLWIRAQVPDDFFRARFLMECTWRALTSAGAFLVASTIIPMFGYPAVFWAGAVLSGIAALAWCLPGLRQRARG
jgi:hypothetical protein